MCVSIIHHIIHNHYLYNPRYKQNSLPGTIKIIGLCRNARAQKGVGRTEPDNFYSSLFSRPYQKKLFFPSLQIAYSVPTAAALWLLRHHKPLCEATQRIGGRDCKGLCTEYHKLSSLRSLNCSQVKIARTAKETSADDAVRCGKGEGRNGFVLHQKQSDYAGKLWLKIVQSPVCVAFFQYRDDNRENFALLAARRALQCQCQPKGSKAPRIRKNVILENTSEIKTPPQLQCTGRE